MYRFTIAGVVLATGFATAAPALKDPPAKTDPLVGVWTLESLAFSGMVRPDPDGLRWEFTADGKYIKHRGDKKSEFRYTREPKADPRAVDLREGPDVLDAGVVHGIYQVEGDRLTIALPKHRGAPRPADFETPKDGQVAVCVFRRVKPKH